MTRPRPGAFRRHLAVAWLPVLMFMLAGAAAGCSNSGSSAPSTLSDSPGATSGAGVAAAGRTMGHAMPASGEADAMWAARPDFVRTANARTQEAYAFAIARPDVTDWMPCYCGCVAIDHRNNTDCYLKPRAAGAAITYDEHASYCGICVDIALKAKTMIGEGRTLTEIRAAVDAEFSDSAPGTDTALPPS